jgi:hypothetical protein
MDVLWLDVRSLKRPLLGVLLGLLLASAFAVAGPRQAFAVQAMPKTDWSFYVRTTNTNTLYNLGCNQGNFDRNNGNINSEVVLDFGGQASNNGGTYLTGSNTYVSYATIESLAEQFALAYYVCTGSDTTSLLKLNLGTNNSAYYVNTAGGNSWGSVVNAVNTYVTNNGYSSQVLVGGANDMEPSWNTQSNTIAWMNGYTSTSGRYFVNYGSTDGCPQSSHNNGGCNNGWNQYGIWYVSWGAAPAWPLPEIYYQSQTNQWVQVDLYSSQYQGGSMTFVGPFDEYDLDTSTFTASGAWNSLWNGLNGAGEYATMSFSCEIHIAS